MTNNLYQRVLRDCRNLAAIIFGFGCLSLFILNGHPFSMNLIFLAIASLSAVLAVGGPARIPIALRKSVTGRILLLIILASMFTVTVMLPFAYRDQQRFNEMMQQIREREARVS